MLSRFDQVFNFGISGIPGPSPRDPSWAAAKRPPWRGLGEKIQELLDRDSRQFRGWSRRVEERGSGRVRM